MPARIPVIDLFAGPGGLSEGFASCENSRGDRPFHIGLSIEKDPIAHLTLELRAFFRQFPAGKAPAEYYQYLRNPSPEGRAELLRAFPKEAAAAAHEAWNTELGGVDVADLDDRIRKARGSSDNWIVIGGPPCQAYSLVGRSRRGGISAEDKRVHLYKEYLRILAEHQPPVFVMENVTGLLSAKLDGNLIFDRMQADLSAPTHALGRRGQSVKYEIRSLVKPRDQLFKSDHADPRRFVIRSEHYGIPQSRHRVILLGVRSDLANRPSDTLEPQNSIDLKDVLDVLPRVRSGVSRGDDSPDSWKEIIRSSVSSRWFRTANGALSDELRQRLQRNSDAIPLPRADRGAEFLNCDAEPTYRSDWYCDKRLPGVCNHSTRSHIPDDLHRYFFAATYASVEKSSPSLANFPPALLPLHNNVEKGVGTGHFGDRFRVQISGRPATTITSHIAKDGHYYIHYDPKQCRSFTVREAARIQTFPDNYFFCGNRTQQYHQVGNAVPPLLARQISEVVLKLLGGKC
jgi:DNA (cytosine-5)-methyltransferase 1